VVKAEEAIVFLLLLLGIGKKKPPDDDEKETQAEACVRLGGTYDPIKKVCVFTRPPDPPIEGCGPQPPATFQKGAGYWWQPATDAVGWNSNVNIQRPDASVILSINEAFSQPLANWYKCERVTDPIRILTQFI